MSFVFHFILFFGVGSLSLTLVHFLLYCFCLQKCKLSFGDDGMAIQQNKSNTSLLLDITFIRTSINLGIQNESTITIIYSTVDMVLFHRKFTTKWSFFYIILDVILRTRVLVLKVFQRSFEAILWPFKSKQNEGNDPDKSKSNLNCYDVLSFCVAIQKNIALQPTRNLRYLL